MLHATSYVRYTCNDGGGRVSRKTVLLNSRLLTCAIHVTMGGGGGGGGGKPRYDFSNCTDHTTSRN